MKLPSFPMVVFSMIVGTPISLFIWEKYNFTVDTDVIVGMWEDDAVEQCVTGTSLQPIPVVNAKGITSLTWVPRDNYGSRNVRVRIYRHRIVYTSGRESFENRSNVISYLTQCR